MGENVIALVPRAETESALGVYEQMCQAIAECLRVDDVKQILDKAAAIEEYARRAGNFEPERQAAEIRIRCERRAGELLREITRSSPFERACAGGKAKAALLYDTTKQLSPYAQTLADNHIDRWTAHRYQQLASVPHETFEAALASPGKKPTSAGVLRAAKTAQPAPVGPAKDLADIEITPAEMDRLVDPLVGVITGSFFTGLGMPGHPDFPAVAQAIGRGGHRRAKGVRAAIDQAIAFLTAIRTELDHHE
jgi:hypothetical protein